MKFPNFYLENDEIQQKVERENTKGTQQFVSYPWLQIVTQVIIHNLGNKLLGQAGPNSITQAMIYNLGYDVQGVQYPNALF